MKFKIHHRLNLDPLSWVCFFIYFFNVHAHGGFYQRRAFPLTRWVWFFFCGRVGACLPVVSENTLVNAGGHVTDWKVLIPLTPPPPPPTPSVSKYTRVNTGGGRDGCQGILSHTHSGWNPPGALIEFARPQPDYHRSQRITLHLHARQDNGRRLVLRAGPGAGACSRRVVFVDRNVVA